MTIFTAEEGGTLYMSDRPFVLGGIEGAHENVALGARVACQYGGHDLWEVSFYSGAPHTAWLPIGDTAAAIGWVYGLEEI